MEITPEVRVIKNAYMKAKNENNIPEMNRLKSKAMSIVKTEKLEFSDKVETTVSKNKDGDSIEISQTGKQLNKSAI